MRRLGLFLVIVILVAPLLARAGDEREIDVPGATGIRLFIGTADGSLPPQARVDAAKSAYASQFGTIVGTSLTRTVEAQGHRFTASFARFASDPSTVHSWVSGDSSTRVCHIIVPASSRGPLVNSVVDRCYQELLGSASPALASTATSKLFVVNDAKLAAALASVPASHRPLAMVLRSQMRFSGGFAVPAIEPWMLFPNGYATSCYGWDPALLDPTPQALGVAPLRCTVVHWRRAADGYQFEEKPGSFGPMEKGTVLKPFTPGEHLSLNLTTVSGSGSGPAIAGVTSVNSVSSGNVRMTSDGNVTIGSWTSVAVSGSNVGGGATAQRGPLHGRYYVNGYLIAIGDSDGFIHRGFVGIDREAKTYLYLNGTEYWPG